MVRKPTDHNRLGTVGGLMAMWVFLGVAVLWLLAGAPGWPR